MEFLRHSVKCKTEHDLILWLKDIELHHLGMQNAGIHAMHVCSYNVLIVSHSICISWFLVPILYFSGEIIYMCL